jgi:Uma2 family endonuclease
MADDDLAGAQTGRGARNMPLTQQTYAAVVVEDLDGKWELHRGRLREKPPTTHAHNSFAHFLGVFLTMQLDWREFEVLVDAGKVRRLDVTYYIPDVFVFPARLADPFRGRVDVLEVYDEPLPLVVEVWSPSTATYDVNDKIPEYKRRGDLEIWRVHPYDRTVTIWRLQQDGSYSEETVTGGILRPAFLPNVAIDLDELFARL